MGVLVTVAVLVRPKAKPAPTWRAEVSAEKTPLFEPLQQVFLDVVEVGEECHGFAV